MSTPENSIQPNPKPRLRLGCLLAAVVTLAILAALAPCQMTSTLLRGQMIQTINNQKQIYFAASSMATDGFESKNPKLGWPGDLAASKEQPIASLARYVKYLTENDYIKQVDVGKLFAAPGIRAYTGVGEFTSANSAFKIYKVRQSDVEDVIFSATKNFTLGKGLDPNVSPYGEKGFAIIRKGGNATPFYNKKSALTRTLGLMPGHTSNDPGTETNDSILSM